MAIVTIQGGAKFETATPDEVRKIMQHEAATERERYRAIKDFRRNVQVVTTAATYSTLTDYVTPEAGYKWLVRLLSVSLASAGTGQAFITSQSGAAPVLTMPTQSRCIAEWGTSLAYQVSTFGMAALVLNEGEGLFFNTTANVTGYMLQGWLTPAELVGRLS